MKLSIKKQITQREEIEISLPAFFERNGVYRSLNEDGDLIIVGRGYIALTPKEDSTYDKDVAEVLGMTTCGKVEFEQYRDNVLQTFYQAFGIESVTA